VAIYLSREMTPHSMLRIAQAFSLADHSTISYSIKRAKENKKVPYGELKEAILKIAENRHSA
jgi:chromosomal replication initiation ATPase DnaA